MEIKYSESFYEVAPISYFINSGELSELIFVQQGKEREVVNDKIFRLLLKEAGL